MAMVNTLRTSGTAETVTLGGVSMTAEQFSLNVQRNTVRQTLCDGTQVVTVFGELPCTLTLTGRIIPDDGTSLAGKLRTLLSGSSTYTFACRGCNFQNMRITALSCSTGKQQYDAELSLTLIGTLKGVSP